MPEGLDDCVIESANGSTWIQVKSRKEGTFRKREVRKFLDAMDEKAVGLSRDADIRTAVVLEQPCAEESAVGLDGLLDGSSRRVVVCNAPEKEIINILARQLDTAPLIAEGLVSDLYKLIADASAQNASLPFQERKAHFDDRGRTAYFRATGGRRSLGD